MAKAIFLFSLGGLLFVYVGYPVVLQLIVSFRGARAVRRGPALPRVSLVISAYNEEAVIERKLQNALAIDYPPALLEIVVVSDASSDRTDAIVRGFTDPRLRLFRQDERRGKTAGLNAAIPTLDGEIVIFSDANAIYEPDAVRKLVRNFADPQVGCVTGEARYLKVNRSTADVSERAYWTYEIVIKRLETAVGSMVGGDGAIYAIRKSLWQTLPEDAINDFLNPLQIVRAGWRGVYEPEAVCWEETAAGMAREWKRRVRIVSRSWRAVFQARGVLNPFSVGLFAFCLIFHKVLRWLSGMFLGGAAGATLWISVSTGALASTGARLGFISMGLALAFPWSRRVAGFLWYFALINAASLVGVARGTLGHVSGVWTTPRNDTETGFVWRAGIPTLVVAVVALVAAGTTLAASGTAYAEIIFWAAVSVLGYVYVGYPLVLRAWAALASKPVARSQYLPRVCLLIAANDEEAVLARKLENSLSLDYPAGRLSVILASDGSVDRTNEIARAFDPRVRLLAFPTRRGKIAAINEAMRSVDAEVVVLSDANTFLRPDAVRKLVQNFADLEVGAVSGNVALTGERAALAGCEDLYYRYERHLQRLESEIGSLVGVDGALYAIRRALFTPPPSDTILDDMAIPMSVLRSGHRVVFEVDAVAEESGSASSTEEFWRKVRVVAGAVQFLLRSDSGIPIARRQAIFTLVSHKALRWMSPAFGAVAFFSSALLAISSPFFAWIFVLECAVIALGLAGCVPAIRRLTVVALPHYFCLVQGAAAVGLLRGLAGRQPVAWRRFARATVHPV